MINLLAEGVEVLSSCHVLLTPCKADVRHYVKASAIAGKEDASPCESRRSLPKIPPNRWTSTVPKPKCGRAV